jgi:hypothetical protein
MSHETDNFMVSQIGRLALTARDVLVPRQNERKGGYASSVMHAVEP